MALPWVCRSNFSKAVEQSDFETVDAMLEDGFDIDTELMSKKTAIHISIANGLDDITKLLIARGCSLSLKTDKGETPLHLAVLYKKYELVKLLLENRADITSIDSSGRTALHYQNAMESSDIASLLISYISSNVINTRDYHGRTPLMYACQFATIKEIAALLNKGAKVNVISFDKMTPMLLCLHNSSSSAEMINHLLDAGAHINQADVENPLLLALRCGLCFPLHKSRLLSLSLHLIERGCDATDKDLLGETALHMAVLLKDTTLVIKLLNYGAEVHASNGFGITPLLYACRRGFCEVIDVLIEAGANLNLSHGPTIFDQWLDISCTNTPLSKAYWELNPLMYALYKTIERLPLSKLCRRVIRQNLPPNKVSSAPHLPLPKSLVRFLLFELD